jgi:hypothetical protein
MYSLVKKVLAKEESKTLWHTDVRGKISEPRRTAYDFIKGGRSANKFRKSQIRKFADLNNYLDLLQMLNFRGFARDPSLFEICKLN